MLKKYRKFVTSSVGFTFAVVGFTGVIFKLFFKTHALEQIHGWLGLALVVAAILHISQNWTAVSNYLRDTRVLSLLIPIVVLIVAFSLAPEKKGVNVKQVANRLSRASLADAAKALGRDPQSVTTAMSQDGVVVLSSSETLQDIAKRNQKTPDSILNYFLGPAAE